ncbi:MAG: argininosuccinate lyase [Bacillota bacterium]
MVGESSDSGVEKGGGPGKGAGDGGARPGPDKLWGGRFTKGADARAARFTASLSFDRRLCRQDIAGSRAHARMLGKSGILAAGDVAAILGGLDHVEEEIESGAFPWRPELEDIHTNVERRLTELIGPTGGKLHTARSRNDQVALDMHLYMKEELGRVLGLIRGLQKVIVDRAEEHLGVGGPGAGAMGPGATVMPGYTHLQRAQPVLFSHHLLAYFWMLQRDRGRFADCLRRTDASPLGAGALAGTSFPIDPEAVAADLGLAGVYENSLDAVSDRDFLLEFLAAGSILMVHLSRLGEELVLWSTAEFGFIEMDDAFATGSSIMPQKKNPDVAELVRGKAGRVFGNLAGLLATMKGLPLAYHSDLQEDKEATFGAVDTVEAALEVAAGMLATMKVKAEAMGKAAGGGFSTATEVADHLAKKGLPFRQAHEVVGRIVLHCLERGLALTDLTLEDFREFSPLFGEDILAQVRPEMAVAARTSAGGPSPEQVSTQIAAARELLGGNPS